MAAAPRCSFCPAVAVRQGRPAGSGDRYVAMCGSDRCAAELANRPNLALVGRPMGADLNAWLDKLGATMNTVEGRAIVAAAKKAADNSRTNTLTLQGYTFLVFPQVFGDPDKQNSYYVSSLPLGRGYALLPILIEDTLNTPELLAQYVRSLLGSAPSLDVASSRTNVFIVEGSTVRYKITPKMPVGSKTEPSFWVIEGDGDYLIK